MSGFSLPRVGSIVPPVDVIAKAASSDVAATTVPVFQEFAADLETPVGVFLKLRQGHHSFLLESVEGGETRGRYSIIGTNPRKVIRTGKGFDAEGDPTEVLQAELSKHKQLDLSAIGVRIDLPGFSGGAMGFVTYDCIRHFEPRTSATIEKQADPLKMPEAAFMFVDSVVVFDHARHTLKVLTQCQLPSASSVSPSGHSSSSSAAAASGAGGTKVGEQLAAAYEAARARIADIVRKIERGRPVDAAPASPKRPPSAGSSSGSSLTREAWEATSNAGRAGYEGYVRSLKKHIVAGDIIQAVPSHRLSRPLPEGLTAFDLYRHLRIVNPSPYMFYVDMGEGTSIAGASPEMLCKVEAGVVQTHPIAGTRKRGKGPAEDEALKKDLLSDEKERAEHIMLVDLGRNDVGRVAAPGSVKVDSLMGVEMYSHVMHIVSKVSGRLAEGKTALDAFKSIFPAGTLSGAPKVRAVELVAGLEPERRYIYGGAVGSFGYNGDLDTAIAIRTVWVHDGVLHLQAGGGIVFDSVPSDEYEETMNKLGGVIAGVNGAVRAAEARAREGAPVIGGKRAQRDGTGAASGGAGSGSSGATGSAGDAGDGSDAPKAKAARVD